MAIRIIQTDQPLQNAEVLALRDLLRAGALTAAGEGRLDVTAIVRDIIDQVAQRGDAAVIELTERIDHVKLKGSELRITAARIRQAHRAADRDFLALARRVIANIRQYQEHIKVRAPADLVKDGRRLGVRYTPMERVGVYVPGWKAIYPSTLLMTVAV
jgi:histidinol dehydrogenase